jgi:hypothetical protein
MKGSKQSVTKKGGVAGNPSTAVDVACDQRESRKKKGQVPRESLNAKINSNAALFVNS